MPTLQEVMGYTPPETPSGLAALVATQSALPPTVAVTAPVAPPAPVQAPPQGVAALAAQKPPKDPWAYDVPEARTGIASLLDIVTDPFTGNREKRNFNEALAAAREMGRQRQAAPAKDGGYEYRDDVRQGGKTYAGWFDKMGNVKPGTQLEEVPADVKSENGGYIYRDNVRQGGKRYAGWFDKLGNVKPGTQMEEVPDTGPEATTYKTDTKWEGGKKWFGFVDNQGNLKPGTKWEEVPPDKTETDLANQAWNDLLIRSQPTQDQSKNRSYARSVDTGIFVFSNLRSKGYDPTKDMSVIKEISTNGITGKWVNSIKDPRTKQFMQAAQTIINAKLRRESGATITPDEFNLAYSTIIPVAGDDPETAAQKYDAIEQLLGDTLEASGVVADEESKRLYPYASKFTRKSTKFDPDEYMRRK